MYANITNNQATFLLIKYTKVKSKEVVVSKIILICLETQALQ